jgi:hypothetical protein
MHLNNFIDFCVAQASSLLWDKQDACVTYVLSGLYGTISLLSWATYYEF